MTRRSLVAVVIGVLLAAVSGCGGGTPIPSMSVQAEEACAAHRGVRQVVLEPYDPEFGGGGFEAAVCRDGAVR